MLTFERLGSIVRGNAPLPDPSSPFDPRSIPVYIGIAVLILVEMAYVVATDLRLDPNQFFGAFYGLALIAACGLVAHRYGMTQTGGILQGFALPPILGALTFAGSIILARHSTGLADASLAAADSALGFDWLALFHLYQANPAVVAVSRWIYASMLVQLPLVTILLFALGDANRGWSFVTAWWIACLLTLAIFPLAPAAGPFVLNGIAPADIPNLLREFPWTTGPTIAGLRDGSISDASQAMAGLVSFPSFHTAAGVMFAWAAWPFRWPRWPMVILNLAMIASTLVSGSHYLIDLIGGAAVAFIAIAIAKVLVLRRAVQLTTYAQPTRPEAADLV